MTRITICWHQQAKNTLQFTRYKFHHADKHENYYCSSVPVQISRTILKKTMAPESSTQQKIKMIMFLSLSFLISQLTKQLIPNWRQNNKQMILNKHGFEEWALRQRRCSAATWFLRWLQSGIWSSNLKMPNIPFVAISEHFLVKHINWKAPVYRFRLVARVWIINQFALEFFELWVEH